MTVNKQIEQKLIDRDSQKGKLEAKVKQLEYEVDRRKFVEAKVQTYVRSLIDQNEKCKAYIEGLAKEQAEVASPRAGLTAQRKAARAFLVALDTN